ncbi:uncharacterized protein LOC123011562 [Tribolium madens]|uniref:uncharacterized protein LOC123011562 n=1 Tax=Tribolium madens TaxID=41895 RepID=UPI001CF74299|nr:uncharacterized protein LOC123011562 [Tribolium madens]
MINMIFPNQKLIPLFCMFLIRETSETQCVSIINNSTGIEWPSTRNRALSRPICLNQNKEFVYRTCVNGNWESEPYCHYTQPEKLPECPEGFNESVTTCYTLSEKSAYPPRCVYPQTLPFSLYKEIVDSEIDFPVWVPARRDLSNGLGFVQWTEPSFSYKTEITYQVAKSVKNNCIVYHNKTFTLTSCQEEHFGVCAYLKLNQLVENICDTDFYCLQGDFNAKSKCFCKKSTMGWVNHPAEFLKPYQYSIYGRLTNETCAMGLTKASDGRYIWQNSGKELEYTFWSKNVDFIESGMYAAATPEGWVLSQVPTFCTLFELEVEDLEPSLTLSFNESTNEFSVEVSNPKRIKFLYSNTLIFCFTDADGSTLVFRYPALNAVINVGEGRVFNFEPLGTLPGNYWCEAFKFVDLAIIKSEVYFYRPKIYPEFVTILSMRYKNFNPLSSDLLKMLNKSELFHSLKNNLYILQFYQLRIMKIIDVDENTNRVLVNVHLSSNFGNSSVNETSQYETIKRVVTQTINNLKTEQFELIDFLSSDFCPNESNSLTWPETPINSNANPQEFCFTTDGKLVTRLCYGNFIDGAKWLDYKDCVIFPTSNITKQLLMISNFSKSLLLDTLFNLSKHYQDFKSVDVYLFAEKFNDLNQVNITPNDLVLFAKIQNNLAKIDRYILGEAQRMLGTTDKFLWLIETFSQECNESFEIYGLDNFVLVSIESIFLSGLAVEKHGDKFVVNKLFDDHSVSELLKNPNLTYAIWLSPKIRQKIPQDVKITLWYFDNDSFFQQTMPGLEASPIFGILHPESVTLNDDSVRVLYRVKPDQKVHFCGQWTYTLSRRGFWARKGQIRDVAPFVLCEFGEGGNFGLISFNDNNVTDDLIDLLDSNDTVPETLDKLSHISERYEQFKPIDVSIVGQILDKINYDEEIDLRKLAFTISNLHQIDRKILLNSQLKDKSTDLILANIDIILQKQAIVDKTQIIVDNFFIFIVHFTKEIDGFALLNHEDVLEPIILEGNVSIDEVAKFECFDSAVVLSSDLKNQIRENTKIIVTVFVSNALFNEKSPNHNVGKIFGVILPLLEEFHGPVSIFYKPVKEINQECVFWNYSHNIPGSWQNDTKIRNSYNLTRCDFWHTTHFAQLILDEDKHESTVDDPNVLSIITSINCGISLIGLSFIILTAIIFKRWRENTGNQILLNFSIVIIVQIAIFYISNSVNEFHKNYIFCTVIGVSLHYSIISQFCWMLVIAILQFRRFVTVLEGPPKYILLKACVCGWILPLFPVLAVFISDKNNYVNSSAGLCYPSGLGLYLGVWLPVVLVIVINSVIFTVTLYNVVHKKTDIVFNGYNEALYQWRLAVMLFFMLGLTWCFGFFAKLDFGLIFEYLFCITATLQGFTIFLFFIVFNVNTRYLYIGVINRYCYKINN